jgi:hypothetical protein
MLPKRHDEPEVPKTPPSQSATTTLPPTTPPREGLTLRTDTSDPRRYNPPSELKPSSGPTILTDKAKSPRSPEGLSNKARELETEMPATEEDEESPKRAHAPAPTKPLPDTPTTVPISPEEGETTPTEADDTYWYKATEPLLTTEPARTPTKPAVPDGATHTTDPSPEDVPDTTVPPNEQLPPAKDDPITVTTPPPDTRPRDGSTLSATPPSTYVKETPLKLYSLSPTDTSTETRPEL